MTTIFWSFLICHALILILHSSEVSAGIMQCGAHIKCWKAVEECTWFSAETGGSTYLCDQVHYWVRIHPCLTFVFISGKLDARFALCSDVHQSLFLNNDQWNAFSSQKSTCIHREGLNANVSVTARLHQMHDTAVSDIEEENHSALAFINSKCS